jgi:hypothetical protein
VRNLVDNLALVIILLSMAKKRPVTRAERRAARPVVADARVYGVEITDAGAQCWTSRIIFFASSPGEATDLLRAANLYKRVISRYLRESDVAEDGQRLARENPKVLFLSQYNDDGWSGWMRLPEGYVHPPQGLATKHPELRWPP